jgi:hypothetical protein
MKQEQSVLNEVENLEKLAEVYIKDVLNKKANLLQTMQEV